MKPDEVGADTVRTLASMAGLSLPEDDVPPLVEALRVYLAEMEALVPAAKVELNGGVLACCRRDPQVRPYFVCPAGRLRYTIST